tara:strand:+ start:8571 stop:9560 length:990 start_codon:yes stop_codon:yes gene_type:complete
METMIRYGLCCISNELQRQGSKFQTMTFKRFSALDRDEAVATLCGRYANNLRVISAILDQCAEHGWIYRASSDIFPLMTHPDSGLVYDDLPNAAELDALFAECADKISRHGIRVSCHPDQFNVLASKNDRAVENTIRELDHHGWFMDKIGAPRSYEAPINIHVNCSSDSPEVVARRFARNLARCSEAVRSRLAVENEDKGIWTAEALCGVLSLEANVPVTFDNLHHACNPGSISEQAAFELCYLTWLHYGDIVPLFHYCEALPDQPNPRKHAEMPVGYPNNYGMPVDFDIELKGKDDAIKQLEINVAPVREEQRARAAEFVRQAESIGI